MPMTEMVFLYCFKMNDKDKLSVKPQLKERNMVYSWQLGFTNDSGFNVWFLEEKKQGTVDISMHLLFDFQALDR